MPRGIKRGSFRIDYDSDAENGERETPPNTRKETESACHVLRKRDPNVEVLGSLDEDSRKNELVHLNGKMKYDNSKRKAKWRHNLKLVFAFIDLHGKGPSEHDKTDAETKRLGVWLSHQKANYKRSQFIMLQDHEICTEWEEALENEKYGKHLLSSDKDSKKIWRNNLKSVCAFIDSKGRAPVIAAENNTEEKRLAHWISNQKTYYKNNQYILRQESEICKEWEEALENEKYGKYLILTEPCDKKRWRDNIKAVCDYIDSKGKAPTQHDKTDGQAKRLGKWLSHQKRNYKNNLQIMQREPEIRREWEEVLENDKYRKYFSLIGLYDKKIWRNNLRSVCAYIDSKGKAPFVRDKGDAEGKRLGSWVATQKAHYKYNQRIMLQEPDIRELWGKAQKFLFTKNWNGLRKLIQDELEDETDQDCDGNRDVKKRKYLQQDKGNSRKRNRQHDEIAAKNQRSRISKETDLKRTRGQMKEGGQISQLKLPVEDAVWL